MREHTNISKSARGQAGHDLWDELTQTPPEMEPSEIVDGVVDCIVKQQMGFNDLADYIDYNGIEFHALNEVNLQIAQTDPIGTETPISFLRRMVRADLTDYVMQYTLPRLLTQRAKGFVYNKQTHSWWDKEFAAAHGIA